MSQVRNETPSQMGSEPQDEFYARSKKLFFLLTCLTYPLGIVAIGGFLFFDVHSLSDAAKFVALAGIPLILLFHSFVAAIILVLYWKPLLFIGPDYIRFAIIGLTICRDEVRSVTARRSGGVENGRVVIELAAPRANRFRVFLFFPIAGVFKSRIYIALLWLQPEHNETAQHIIAALSPRSTQ